MSKGSSHTSLRVALSAAARATKSGGYLVHVVMWHCLAIACVCLLVAACASVDLTQNASSDSPQSGAPSAVIAGDECAIIKPPKTPTELLQNLLCITKKSTTFDEDVFVDDGKLWELTAGKTFSRGYPPRPESQYAKVTNFPLSFERSLNESRRLAVSFSMTYKPFEFSIIVFDLDNSGLRFDDIEKIYGKEWKSQRLPINVGPHTLPLPRAIDPHGNQQLEYTFAVSHSANAQVAVYFDHKGIASSVYIKVKEGNFYPDFPWLKKEGEPYND